MPRPGYDDNRKTTGAPPTPRHIQTPRRDIADHSPPDKGRKDADKKGEKK